MSQGGQVLSVQSYCFKLLGRPWKWVRWCKVLYSTHWRPLCSRTSPLERPPTFVSKWYKHVTLPLSARTPPLYKDHFAPPNKDPLYKEYFSPPNKDPLYKVTSPLPVGTPLTKITLPLPTRTPSTTTTICCHYLGLLSCWLGSPSNYRVCAFQPVE